MVPAKVFVLFAIIATTLYVVQGSTEILGKGVRVFTSGGNLSLTCEYSSTTDLSQSDLQELKFYDKSGVEFGSTRNFMQAHTTLSTRKISVTLTKASVDRSDGGKYVCKFKNANDFQIDVAIVHFTAVEDEYNMTAGNKQTNRLQCSYSIEKENSVQMQDSINWEREGKPVDSVSTRHKANGTVLTIENADCCDVGPYTCIVTVTWGTMNSEMVAYVVPLKGALCDTGTSEKKEKVNVGGIVGGVLVPVILIAIIAEFTFCKRQHKFSDTVLRTPLPSIDKLVQDSTKRKGGEPISSEANVEAVYVTIDVGDVDDSIQAYQALRRKGSLRYSKSPTALDHKPHREDNDGYLQCCDAVHISSDLQYSNSPTAHALTQEETENVVYTNVYLDVVK